jgi:hypothetical protein
MNSKEAADETLRVNTEKQDTQHLRDSRAEEDLEMMTMKPGLLGRGGGQLAWKQGNDLSSCLLTEKTETLFTEPA